VTRFRFFPPLEGGFADRSTHPPLDHHGVLPLAAG